MAQATLTIGSKNYASWSMRGWLLAKFSKLPFDEQVIPSDDPAMRVASSRGIPRRAAPARNDNYFPNISPKKSPFFHSGRFAAFATSAPSR